MFFNSALLDICLAKSLKHQMVFNQNKPMACASWYYLPNTNYQKMEALLHVYGANISPVLTISLDILLF